MAESANTIALTILEREYRINCPEGAEEELRETARFLDQKMTEIKEASSNAGKVVGTDRIAVIAALNITHQLLENGRQGQKFDNNLEQIHARLDEVLARDQQLEL